MVILEKQRLVIEINQCMPSSYQVIKLAVHSGEQVYPAYNLLHSFKAVCVICYIPLADLDPKEWFTDKCSLYCHILTFNETQFLTVSAETDI